MISSSLCIEIILEGLMKHQKGWSRVKHELLSHHKKASEVKNFSIPNQILFLLLYIIVGIGTFIIVIIDNN